MKMEKDVYELYSELFYCTREFKLLDNANKNIKIHKRISEKFQTNLKYIKLRKSIIKNFSKYKEYVKKEAKGGYIDPCTLDPDVIYELEKKKKKNDELFQFIIDIVNIIYHLYSNNDGYDIPCEYYALKVYDKQVKGELVYMCQSSRRIIIPLKIMNNEFYGDIELKLSIPIKRDFEYAKRFYPLSRDRNFEIRYLDKYDSLSAVYQISVFQDNYSKYKYNIADEALRPIFFALSELEPLALYLLDCFAKSHKKYILYPWNVIDWK